MHREAHVLWQACDLLGKVLDKVKGPIEVPFHLCQPYASVSDQLGRGTRQDLSAILNKCHQIHWTLRVSSEV